MAKAKVLFVLGDLTQGGSGRYLYEVCRAIDSTKNELSVLTRRDSLPSDYYHSRLLALGVSVHPLLWMLPRTAAELIPDKRRARPVRRAIEAAIDAAEERIHRARIAPLAARYDTIAVLQIENYLWLQRSLLDHPNVVIHLVSERWQYDHNPYDRLLPRRYRLVVQHDHQPVDIRGSLAEGADILDFPLPLAFEDRQDVYTYPLDHDPRIAVFIRFNPQRPFDALIYAFQALCAKRPGARLHLFGGGDPSAIERLASLLSIRDHIIFEGHTADLGRSLREGRFHMVWNTSVGQHMGYSSIETASYGVPVIYWNQSPVLPEEVDAQTGGAVRVANTVPAFTDLNLALLRAPDELRRTGQKLRAYLRARHDISPRIDALTAFYEQGVTRAGSG